MEFEEKEYEWSTKQNQEIPVIISNKYKEAKKKAIELITDGKYGLAEADFWILMNETKTGKMMYTTLILSHNGCLKINDKLENKFNPDAVTIVENGYKSELVFTYRDKEQGIFEVGEVSEKNCKNEYPYAMALKRCFDRVVLKLSKLAFSGIMSDSEAEDSKKEDEEKNIENDLISETKVNALEKAIKKYKISDAIVDVILSNYEYKALKEIKEKDYMKVVNDLSLNK
jgi:hypothetical protein